MTLKLTVLGSGREVGRAALLLEDERSEKRILLDYGVTFDESDIPVFPLSVPPAKLKAIAITHAHLDHVGAAPMLFVSVRVPTIMTSLTKEFAKLMIEDMIKLAGYYLPYEYPELETMLNSVHTISPGGMVEIDGIRIEALNAGHIPGSVMYRIEMGGKVVLYTGDVNTIDTKLVSGARLEGVEANILIMESTYGNVDHPDRKEVEDRFIETIKSVIEDGGSVLIPAFALGRSQEILSILAERMPYANVYYDGMTRKILELMLSYPKYINRIDLLEKAARLFVAVQGADMRKRVYKEPGSIIVAPAGMLKGGPALYYLKRMWNAKKCAIILVSYQAPATPGRRILSEGTFEENGPRVQARVYWFDFSSHAGASGLLSIVKSVKGLEKVILVHGGDAVAYELAYRIKEEIGVDVEVPSNGSVIKLD
ncbi:MAG TPA: MBL fold metallo-hydrolase [Ignisphaera aggregans]|uniref:MBL fold metallo-hydrolase n=1 Tax=Ignisphaera aggregans TaxID=334771 RepID=A0A832YXJ6_9CREN|nr:MBL fold metallo-hydrolase [Ignisphaera aggregans]